MKTRFGVALFLFLVSFLLFVAGCDSAGDMEAKLDEINNRVEALESKINDLESEK